MNEHPIDTIHNVTATKYMFVFRQGWSCTDIGSIVCWENPSGALFLHTGLENISSTKAPLSADPYRVAQSICSGIWPEWQRLFFLKQR